MVSRLACGLFLVLTGVAAQAGDDPWPTVYAAFEANDCSLPETSLVEILAARAYDTWTIGCKGGPRFSGGARWLQGWYVHPFAALAWIHVRPLRQGVPGAAPGADGISLGLGVEGGYTWAFSSGFALELGFGLGQTAAVPFGEGETIAGLRPVFNIGLGYAW